MANATTFKSTRIAFLALFFIILACYSNTFHATWHLDDYNKISKTERLQLEKLTWDNITQTFFITSQGGDERLYRPLSCLSLALNWYIGRDNVIGYHIVNISIHYLTACLLFLTLTLIIRTPRITSYPPDTIFWVAFLATVFWAINPVQTQAVTYIVQRMAALTALFYLGALYAYLKARTTLHTRQKKMWYIVVGISFILALGAKENAITLPLALVLMEIVFFQADNRKRVKTLIVAAVGIGAFLSVVGIVLLYVWKGDPRAYFIDLYATRPFSMSERLLTQPRILLFYLSQLFYPAPSRLSIEHDVMVSTGLFSPWTTLPALLAVLALLAVGVGLVRKQPLIAFSLLFFFLGHAIESSILPLELIFEHRNYLPSLFLFVPFTLVLKKGLDNYRDRNRFMTVMIASFTLLVIVGWGTGTYIRNMAWATEKTLWEDAIHKAPRSGRAYHNLAWGYYQKQGRFNEALQLYKKALTDERRSSNDKATTISNIASIYYATGDYERAARLSYEAMKLKPKVGKTAVMLVRSLIKIGKYDQAENFLQNLTRHTPDDQTYSQLREEIHQGREKMNPNNAQ